MGFILVGIVAIATALVVSRGWAAARVDDDSPRTIDVEMRFSRFVAPSFDVAPGETVRFVVHNADPIDHEFILGDDEVQRVHEEGTEAHHPGRPGEMSVAPGETSVTIYTFPTAPTTLLLGCHLPGHYGYGMRADVRVA